MRVSWDDLQIAFEFASSGQPGEAQAFLCRETGKTYIRSDYTDDLEELPEDLDESDKYIEIPHKRDLGLGKKLVLDFASECLPDDFDEIRGIFSRKGAYARFKDLIVRRGALQRWYDFSNKAEEAALREWCKDNDVEIGD